MDRRLVSVLATVFLDGMGIAFTMPVLPDLLREVGHKEAIGWRFGAFLGLYGLMQFLCAPLLGAASDRVGRRPILMLALAGAAIDYLFMAFAPTLGLLFVGRAISGATAASMAVATAYVADISAEDQRARHFGQLSAAVGLGFIAGPALGGLLGTHWVRAPFLGAAMLNGANLLLVFFTLREPKAPRDTASTVTINPFAPLRWALGFPVLLPLIGTFLLFAIIGQIGATIWVLYGEDRFGWGPVTVGLSLAGFGLFHALAQAFLAGPLVDRWGERPTILLSMAADAIASIVIALTSQGGIAFLLLPLFCLGGLEQPALQALLSRAVADDHQGRLQGMLAGLASLATIIAPIGVSTIYFASRTTMPGLVWIIAAALYLPCLPMILRRKSGFSSETLIVSN